MMNEEATIYCTNCGAPIKASARCCLKCGGLNYLNESNASMKHIMEQSNLNNGIPTQGVVTSNSNGVNNNIVNSSTSNVSTIQSNNVDNSSTTNIVSVDKDLSTSFLICGVVNWIFSILFFAFIALAIFSEGLTKEIGLLLSVFSFFFLFIYGFEQIYLESGHPWWTLFVPVYSTMVLSDIAMGSLLYGLLTFLPAIGVIFSFIIFYQLGEKFGKSGLLTLLFTPFMIPIIGYDCRGYVVGNKTKDSINFYIKNGLFALLAISFVLGVILIMFF